MICIDEIFQLMNKILLHGCVFLVYTFLKGLNVLMDVQHM